MSGLRSGTESCELVPRSLSIKSTVSRLGSGTHTGRYVTWEEALDSHFDFVADIDHMTMDTPAPIQAGPDGM